MWSIDLPVSIKLGKKKPKSHPLNLNWYRNAHFHVLNNVKVEFADQVKLKIRHLPKILKLSLQYTLYPRTHQLCDTANVCSIVDKFFCDTLVEAGVLEDDNYTILGDVQFLFGAVDPKNPRATVVITPIETKESDTMKITLDQTEIEAAVREYVNNQVSVNPGQSISIEFTAGRGANGLTASVDIKAASAANETPEVPAEPGTSNPDQGPATTEATSKPSVRRVNGKVVDEVPAEAPQTNAEAPTDTTAAMAKADHKAAASNAGEATSGLFGSL